MVGAWSEVTSLDKAWARDGVMADVKAKAKWRSYDASLASQDTTGRGWLCGGKSKSTDVFVPFAFEIGGALGTEAEAFMREAVKVAEFCRKGQGDLVFQHFATSSDHAENMCVVTFRALRADLVWNTRVGTGVPVEQSSVPVCQQIVDSRQHAREHSWPDRPAATNRPVSARDLTDYGNRHAECWCVSVGWLHSCCF